MLQNDSYKIHHNLGNVYYRKSDYEKALENYDKALKLCDEDYKVYYDIAVTYTKLKDYDKAIENYKAALKLKDDLYTMSGLANAYLSIDKLELAQELADKILLMNEHMGNKISEQIKNKIAGK